MSSRLGPGSTGLAPSGRVRITSRSHGSSAALVTVTAAGGRVLIPEPEVPGVLGRVGGDLAEVFDVGQVAFGVAAYLVFQVLAGQDFSEGRVVDAVGGVLGPGPGPSLGVAGCRGTSRLLSRRVGPRRTSRESSALFFLAAFSYSPCWSAGTPNSASTHSISFTYWIPLSPICLSYAWRTSPET